MSDDLAKRRCRPCEGGTPPLEPAQARHLLGRLAEGWALTDDGRAIRRTFRFANFHETMAFVNAVAWVAHREDHHPELAVGWGRCTVTWSTHAVGGLSENDFICAAKVDRLVEEA
ncbi:4a-hydroxytetrahydrobiopterin dehydratase [Inmirania thermothiophila]|uniref:Putative pterin-4-alpha-carbinolamine dehydratase n=1 Tax=Inmirania thermothiophila TaxID=1750597 RepID=A0A3N1XZH8_9GAMM|nr:4a-hydroxytetrahydrobiopterin dehydratase [Inmirania thermothiophila]ROR32014.1 pterin-4-alpha-carbinolamine dehydratase [Inmirania thermothiophila]